MFCNQCEQTAGGKACTVKGVCGKTPEADLLQDLLIYNLAGLSEAYLLAQPKGYDASDVDFFIMEGMFATLTNVNFDPERIKAYLEETSALTEKIENTYQVKSSFDKIPAASMDELINLAKEYEIDPKFKEVWGEDIFSLKLCVLYGLKGIAAYAYHAHKLGVWDQEVYRKFKQLLVDVYKEKGDLEAWVKRALEVGELNLKVMELLDKANTQAFGHPVPTKVPLGTKAGKAILVSGHDLEDLYELLRQTEGRGIYIYTHGEMLPAHGYPELKKFPHLYGNYGTAWQNQQKEFVNFPGPIVMTTNCLMPPKEEYKDRVFTLGPVGFSGITHIKGKNFSAVIEKALSMPGFTEDNPGKEVMVGFARNAVLSVADKVIELVKAGKIKHFFLVGGCDGAKPGRNYYTRFVEIVPQDAVILTLACGKYRFYDKDLGDIEGIPRLLDIGQCNDAYSAIQIALALSQAFGVGVNELPLSLVVSWYEQKAVAILLTLLYLGIKNIFLGPSLPAFLSENVLSFLAENYNIRLISEPEKDLSLMLKA